MPKLTVYVCPECSEHQQYAGFCDRCNKRLVLTTCIPVREIEAKRDEFVSNSSPVPAQFIESFVKSLLDR